MSRFTLAHIFIYIVAGAKFEPENTRLMDKQRIKSVLLASGSPYLISTAVSKSFFYRHLISRQRLFRACRGIIDVEIRVSILSSLDNTLRVVFVANNDTNTDRPVF